MISGIHHISMKCGTDAEYARVKDFYLRVLGLSVRRQWAGGVMIDAGNCLLEIFTNGPGVRELGALRHIAFAADDVDDIVRKVRAAGYEVFKEPADICIPSDPPCPARMAFCYGPLGEEIEFFCEKTPG